MLGIVHHLALYKSYNCEDDLLPVANARLTC